MHSASIRQMAFAAGIFSVWQQGPKPHCGVLRAGDRIMACALGRNGITQTGYEGDGATPAGIFALRRVLYRADRAAAPDTALPCLPIGPRDGWCDAPAHPAYNRPVRLPFAASAERLWRQDALYDQVVVLGHNDDPVVPGRGSAIFLHVARPDYGPTLGCVALAPGDLRAVLRLAPRGAALQIAQGRG